MCEAIYMELKACPFLTARPNLMASLWLDQVLKNCILGFDCIVNKYPWLCQTAKSSFAIRCRAMGKAKIEKKSFRWNLLAVA